MRVVVTGSRDATDRRPVWLALDYWHARTQFTHLAHGAQTGVDAMSGAWAEAHNIPSTPYQAAWKKHGRAAGPIRNGQMLRTERPDLVIAMPGGVGTANCVEQARKMGLRVVEVI